MLKRISILAGVTAASAFSPAVLPARAALALRRPPTGIRGMAMQATNKAVVALCQETNDSPKAFTLQELPMPEPKGHDILVKINAIGMNPVDYKARELFEGEKVLGWDACGVVEAVGSETSLFAKGDRVYYAGDITKPGCNQEFQLVDERIVAKAPAKLSDAEAAAMPLTTITAWEALFDRLQFMPEAGANKGKSVVIVGGAGGVGSVAIQLAKWAGLTVYASASRPETVEWCKQLGADVVINHRGGIGKDLAANDVASVDAVLSTAGITSQWASIAEVIKPQGKICMIDDPEGPLDMGAIKFKSVSLHWEFMYTRSMFGTGDIQAQHKLLSSVAALLDSGAIKSTLTETTQGFSTENILAMHKKQAQAEMIGKAALVF